MVSMAWSLNSCVVGAVRGLEIMPLPLPLERLCRNMKKPIFRKTGRGGRPPLAILTQSLEGRRDLPERS
jgi:hypothetical protein